MKHSDAQAAFDPVYGLTERSVARLCALAFIITGDWNLAVDAIVRALDAGWESDGLSKGLTFCTARRLVAAAAVSAIRPQLRESAERIAAMTADPGECLEPEPEMSTGRPPTRADVEQALLAIDGLPRVALLLTIFEGLSIADAGRLLETNEELVKDAQVFGLLALTRQLFRQTREGTLWVCRN
jgi:DNA-directed RNA polymerase specialized sigma24 family protein